MKIEQIRYLYVSIKIIYFLLIATKILLIILTLHPLRCLPKHNFDNIIVVKNEVFSVACVFLLLPVLGRVLFYLLLVLHPLFIRVHYHKKHWQVFLSFSLFSSLLKE